MIPLDMGSITVLGCKTKNDEIQEKGSKVGYMPQETALIGELTVKETVYYFGNIFQMDIDKLRERYEMLHKLLELPYDDHRVEHCSGGKGEITSRIFLCLKFHATFTYSIIILEVKKEGSLLPLP